MAAAFPDAISTDRIVHRVARDGDGIVVDSFDTAAGRTVRTIARAAILAMPHFIARRIAPEDVRRWAEPENAPWLVANGKIGEAACWARVCTNVLISVVAES